MLTQKAKYAIKALIYLAENEGLVKTKDIAENAQIPKKFLESILVELKSHQMVASVQGAAGGYHLMKKPSEINLATIHRIFEGPIALLRCASPNFYQPCTDCPDVPACKIRMALAEIRQKTFDAMQEISLAQLCGHCE